MPRLLDGVLVAASRATRVLPGRGPSPRVRVLCWHAISDFSGDPVLEPYGVPPDLFAAQLDLIARAGWNFVGPEDLASLLRGRAALPAGAVLLTFDDCYVDLLAAAAPALRARSRRVGAVAFAISDAVGGWNTWDQSIGARPMRFLDGAGLRAVQDHGVEIGSHGATHRRMPSLSDPELEAELAGSSSALVALGLARPRFFAYPYGAHDRSTPGAVRRAGYQAAFTGDPGVVTPACDPFRLPRIEILRRDVGWRLLAKVALPRASGQAARAGGLVRRGSRRLLRSRRRARP